MLQQRLENQQLKKKPHSNKRSTHFDSQQQLKRKSILLIKKKFNITLIVSTLFKLQQQITKNEQLTKQFITIKNDELNEIKNNCKNH